MTEALKQAIQHYAQGQADVDGLMVTPIPGLHLRCAFAPTAHMRAMYNSLLCLVFQGAKEVTVGDEVHEFSAGQSLLVSVDLPVVGRIIRASPAEPYLAVSLDLDMGLIRELMGQIEVVHEPAGQRDAAMFVHQTDEAVVDCCARLMRLLDRPDAIPILRPSIIRELHYWLLVGRHGGAIRRLALPNSHTQRITRAVEVLRAEFKRQIPIERLAATAGMSLSSFHQHFKAVTSISPLQFQKQLRLLEARRLMTEGLSASRAAFEVGYESVSQFTREYGRMFGAAPRRYLQENRPGTEAGGDWRAQGQDAAA